MKYLQPALLALLTLAVAFLMVREFSSSGASADGAPGEAEMAEKDFGPNRIAYLNYDSLMAKYEYHQELKSQLEKKALALEEDLAQRSRTFQENVNIFQQRSAGMSPEELQRNQMELQQIQQQLIQYREGQAQALAEQEKELTELLRADLDEVLTGIRKDFNLQLILSYDTRSDLLAVADELNITETVVQRLNAKYRSGKEDSLGIDE